MAGTAVMYGARIQTSDLLAPEDKHGGLRSGPKGQSLIA